ncbi:hypothetical protein ACIO6U_10250 [Streptomyces sp. NPDC087422]|uniref:hypothetical protein n=1 Tax=Streptomyces sp. NPDC087422 TaxID=3365786 RepID=UPI0037FD4D40
MLAQHQMKRSIGIDGTRDTADPRNRQLRHGADLDFVAASVEHQVNAGGSLGVIDWNGSIVFDPALRERQTGRSPIDHAAADFKSASCPYR